MRRIALVDHTTGRYRPEPGVLEAIAEAITIQIERDFAPAWGVVPREVRVGGSGDKIHVFNSARQSDEFGWHTVDGDGNPYAKAYVAGSRSQGSDWLTGDASVASTIGHEALEMLVDPCANEYAFDGLGLLWACEVCDPVQAQSYRIRAGGFLVPVSDFVLPAFFNGWADGPWDHTGVLKEPFSLAEGGYAVCQRKRRSLTKRGRRLTVVFDDAMAQEQRQAKLASWGRTRWRVELQP